jgi:hypothetical protein
MGRQHAVWQPKEERNHKRPNRPVPGVVRGIVSKLWPGKRTRKGRVTK